MRNWLNVFPNETNLSFFQCDQNRQLSSLLNYLDSQCGQLPHWFRFVYVRMVLFMSGALIGQHWSANQTALQDLRWAAHQWAEQLLIIDPISINIVITRTAYCLKYSL